VRVARFAENLDRWASTAVKRPVAVAMSRVGLRATQLNFAGLAGCVAAATLVAGGELFLGGLLFLFASALDAFDGTLAHVRGTARTFSLGGWLDSYFDSVGEAALALALLFVVDDPAFLRLAAASLALTLLVSHAKAVAGEYRIRPGWGEIRLLGRGLRVLIVSIGLIVGGGGGDPRGGLTAMLLILISFNSFVLGGRIVKIVRQARSDDRAGTSE